MESPSSSTFKPPQIRPPALQEKIDDGLLPLGQVETLPGRLLVFPNSHVHKVTELKNHSTEKDMVKKRRIMVSSWSITSTTLYQPERFRSSKNMLVVQWNESMLLTTDWSWWRSANTPNKIGMSARFIFANIRMGQYGDPIVAFSENLKGNVMMVAMILFVAGVISKSSNRQELWTDNGAITIVEVRMKGG